MKILTNKDEPNIREDEFEVWDKGVRLTTGGRFVHINDTERDLSINFVFDDSITKDKLTEVVGLMHDTFMNEKVKK